MWNLLLVYTIFVELNVNLNHLLYNHELKTTNTWAWIKAIPNSKPEKAIINAKGINPNKKNINTRSHNIISKTT